MNKMKISSGGGQGTSKIGRSKVLTAVILVLLVLVIIGASFALWTNVFTGEENAISSEDISIEFLESTDVIDITNALPMSEAQGKSEEDTFDFEVTTRTSRETDMEYSLILERQELDEGYSALNDSDINLYLTDESDSELVTLNIGDIAENEYIIYSDVNEHDSENSEIKDRYSLRVWIDQNVDASDWKEDTKLQYKFKIGVKSNQKLKHKIVFDSNNGNNETIIQYMYEGESQNLQANVFTHQGYIFKGWSTTPNGVVEYEDLETVNNIGGVTQTITLYAVWEKEVKPIVTELMKKIGQGGLEEITHAANSTLQIGSTEDITEYRYRGSAPNNYVYFNCSDIENQSSTTCELYRIIGIFPTDDGTGNIEDRVKLIKAENYRNNYWNSRESNDWTLATLKTPFNTTYWNTINEDYQTLVGDAKYYLGGYYQPLQFRTNAIYEFERVTASISYYYYSGNSKNWTGKMALMYASDYGYAASSECSESKFLYSSSGSSYDYSNSTCTSNNWLYLGVDEWLLPQMANNFSAAFYVTSGGNVTAYIVYNGSFATRPTFYLTSSAQITDGTGTSSDPYWLSVQ